MQPMSVCIHQKKNLSFLKWHQSLSSFMDRMVLMNYLLFRKEFPHCTRNKSCVTGALQIYKNWAHGTPRPRTKNWVPYSAVACRRKLGGLSKSLCYLSNEFYIRFALPYFWWINSSIESPFINNIVVLLKQIYKIRYI